METEYAREMKTGAPGTKATLVLGGTGQTGRRVAEELAARGLPIRVGSRSGEMPFDWGDEATWAPALRDVGTVYVSYYPDLAVPGAVQAVRSFAALAMQQGVRRLLLLSGRGEEEAQCAERAVQEVAPSGRSWSSSFFSQNFSESFFLAPILGGEVALPAGDVPEPFVDAEDIADVAVAALTEDGHAGELYELTGPRLLTFAEAVGEISRAAGRKVRYVPISTEEFASALSQGGVPSEVTEPMIYLFTKVLDGRNAHLTTGVRRALGREPKDFADYARDTAITDV